jgi:uncharacterized glyoxalase superfamily protein PhnB
MENQRTVLTGLVPTLETWNMPATVQFYTEMLGFTMDGKAENETGIYWAMFHRDNVWIMFREPNSYLGYKGPEFSGQLYLYSNNVDEIWLHVKDHCTIVYPIESFNHGMREFAIRDNNGYILSFGKPIDNQ